MLRNSHGNTVGSTVGNTVGDTAGNTEGSTVGNTVGDTAGNTVGSTVGNTVGNNTAGNGYIHCRSDYSLQANLMTSSTKMCKQKCANISFGGHHQMHPNMYNCTTQTPGLPSMNNGNR